MYRYAHARSTMRRATGLVAAGAVVGALALFGVPSAAFAEAASSTAPTPAATPATPPPDTGSTPAADPTPPSTPPTPPASTPPAPPASTPPAPPAPSAPDPAPPAPPAPNPAPPAPNSAPPAPPAGPPHALTAMTTNLAPQTSTPTADKKVWVCKYVDTPFVNERFKGGKNPISVSVNTLKGFDPSNPQFPWAFPDAQGRSVAVAFDTGQDPATVDCPQPEQPTLTLSSPTCETVGGALQVDVTLAGLSASRTYTVTLSLGGSVKATTNVSGVTGYTHTFSVASAGAYSVSVTSGGMAVASGTVQVKPCPPPGQKSYDLSIVKTASTDTESGAVEPNGSIAYTLVVTNHGPDDATNVTVHDPLPADVTYVDGSADLPTGWAIDTSMPGVLDFTAASLASGASVTITFLVEVTDGVPGQDVVNTACVSSDPNLDTDPMNDCSTVETPVANVDLGIVKDTKSHDPVDTGKGDVITYLLTVTNHGTDPAWNAHITDHLPAGLTYVAGSASVSPNDGNWTFSESGGTFTALHSGAFAPGDTFVISFDATVGTLVQPPTGPIPPISNTACVANGQPPAPDIRSAVASDAQPGPDSNPSNDCSTVTTPVKSVAVAGFAQCVLDAPWFTYSVTPFNVPNPSTHPIALIWWTQAAWAAHDPSIPAGDTAALLADGASQVNYIPYPAGWTSGQTISGQQLWPGAAVDASGHGIAWPGWKLLPTGQWVLDPSSPFYDLRGSAVVEIRINPTNDSIVAYPPASPNCNPAPPTSTPSTPAATPGLAETGLDASSFWLPALGLLAAGSVILRIGIRSRRRLE